MARALLALWLAASCIAHAQDYLPDPARAPGLVDLSATLEKVCGTPHYSRTVRPPTSYTSPIKAVLLNGADPALFEVDHRVPLCAGRHPTDARNLWLQPKNGQWTAKYKDQLESSVCRQLCGGGISLGDAQAVFLRPDWTVEYERFFGYR